MIRMLVFGVVAFPSTIFFSLVAIMAGLLRAPKSTFDWVHRNWSRTVLRAAGVEVRVTGLEHVVPNGAQIFVSNHQSMFDIWALFATLPVSLRFVAKKEMSRIPILSHAMRAAGHVFIDRQDRVQAAEAMRHAGKRMLREGLSLGLFPEGTRARDGRLKPFKKGTFVLAIETQTTLVPVAVDGGGEIIVDGGGGPKRRLRPRPIEIRCAEPIPLSGLTAADRDELLARTRAEIVRLLEEVRRTPPGSVRPAATGSE